MICWLSCGLNGINLFILFLTYLASFLLTEPNYSA
jgi:hypothetical protein